MDLDNFAPKQKKQVTLDQSYHQQLKTFAESTSALIIIAPSK